MSSDSAASAWHYVAPVKTATVTVDAVRVSAQKSNLWLDAWRDLRRRPTFWIALLVMAIVTLMAVWPTLFTQTPPNNMCCLLYTSPSPRDRQKSRMPSSA